MKTALSIVIFASGLWAIFWFWGADKNRQFIIDWLTDQQRSGWILKHSEISQLGFPNRYDTTIQSPEIVFKDLKISWKGEFLQLMRLRYKKNHWIIIFPKKQKFVNKTTDYTILTEDMRSSLITEKPNIFRLITQAKKLQVSSKHGNFILKDVQISLLLSNSEPNIFLQCSSIIHEKFELNQNMRFSAKISSQKKITTTNILETLTNTHLKLNEIKWQSGEKNLISKGNIELKFLESAKGFLYLEKDFKSTFDDLFNGSLSYSNFTRGIERLGINLNSSNF